MCGAYAHKVGPANVDTSHLSAGCTPLNTRWILYFCYGLARLSFGPMWHFAIQWISISLSYSSFLIAFVCVHGRPRARTLFIRCLRLVHRCVLEKIMYPAIEDRTWIDDGCYLKNHFRSSVDDFYGRFFFSSLDSFARYTPLARSLLWDNKNSYYSGCIDYVALFYSYAFSLCVFCWWCCWWWRWCWCCCCSFYHHCMRTRPVKLQKCR